MIDPRSFSERLLFSTVRIETNTGSGTGFFYNVPNADGSLLPVVITNNHVVNGATTGIFHVHEAVTIDGQQKPSARSFPVQLSNFESLWIAHPDSNTDLCAMPVGPILNDAIAMNRAIYYQGLSPTVIKSDTELQELNAVEDILMIGYPIGLWDQANNLPLLRRGITSSHPSVDFDGESRGVIDVACFPGSSGSPIVIANDGSYNDRNGNLTVGSRLILLGVLFAGPYMNATGNVVIQQIPTAQQPVSVTPMMIHLGYYVKSKEILALVSYAQSLLGVP